jgi:glycosyltransferase involved in cell wall biosynthesis
MMKIISILIPVFNEDKYIENTLNSVLNFTIPENISIEILIIDGGSTDNTIAIVKHFQSYTSNIKIFSNPKKFQNCGLNIGIRQAKGEWILRLDAHALYPKDYLFTLYNTAISTNAVNIGGIIKTLPGDSSFQAKLVQAITTHPFGVGDATFRTGIKEGPVDTVPFGFFDKQIFNNIGYYNEKLIRGEDYEFNARIRKNNYVVWMNPNIVSTYYNQKSIISFYKKQLLLEGPYNTLMWFLAPYSFAYRHIIPFIFFLGVSSGLILVVLPDYLFYIYISVLFLYFVISIYSSYQQSLRFKSLKLFIFLPLSFFCFHYSYGLGVFLGFIKLFLQRFKIINTFNYEQ